MSDIKKIFQILIKRYSLWIFMVLAIFVIIEGSSARYESSSKFADEIYYDTYELEYLSKNRENIKIDEIENNIGKFRELSQYGLADDYIDKYVKVFKEIVKEKNINKSKLSAGEYFDNYSDFDNSNDDSYIYSILYNFNRLLENEKIVKDPSDGIYKINIAKNIMVPNLFIYAIVFLLGVLLLSGEHLTKYYEFTRMFPWTKNKTYLAKVLFGLLIILAAWLGSIGLKLLIFNSSNYSNITYIYNVKEVFISQGLSLIAFYLIVMGIGALAGNFIGHIGMFIMAIFGIRLYQDNLWAISYLVNGNEISPWVESVENMISSLNPLVKSIISPIDGFSFYNVSLQSAIGLFLVGLLFFFLGIYWTKSSQSERSQMLVIKKGENRFVQIMAILTTSNIIQLIVSSFSLSRITSIIVFLVGLFLSYKFYNILFKSRIGFQS